MCENIGMSSCSYFGQLNFIPCKDTHAHLPVGVYHELSPEQGTGFYWRYEAEGKYAIRTVDLCLKKDYLRETQQEDMITISCYESILALELRPYSRITANSIHAHVADHKVHRVRFHRVFPLRGIELTLTADFCRNYLDQHCPGEFEGLQDAFSCIQGTNQISELQQQMESIRSFNGTGEDAAEFYEEQILTLLNSIISITRERKKSALRGELTQEDLINLDAVRSYIDDYLAFDLKTEQLADIACMGQTKLRYSFKQRFGMTITSYIQNKRMAHAEYLLLRTDFMITKIAEAVGYHHAGRFSGLFKKSTGLFPDEYRKIMKRAEQT